MKWKCTLSSAVPSMRVYKTGKLCVCLCRRMRRNRVFLSITLEVITAKVNDLACVSVFALTLCFSIAIPLIFLMEEDCTFWLQYLFCPHKSHEEQPFLGPMAKCCIRKLYWARNCWANLFAVLNIIGLTSFAEFDKFKNVKRVWWMKVTEVLLKAENMTIILYCCN